MTKNGRSIVDLIYIEPQKNEETVVKEYKFSLEFWKDTLKNLQEVYFEQHFNSTSPDVLEILTMRKFLASFVHNRLNWIENEVEDVSMKRKYLKVLPPFPQKGGIKKLLLHFFQVIESEDKSTISYKSKNDIEKEISILWDIYKLRKTIESIETIKKSLSSSDTFPSVYSTDQRNDCLDSLKTVFQLLFQMCIRKEFQKTLYTSLTTDLIQPEHVLKRQENQKSFVYQHVLQKYDYRNHFFYVYYYPGMKAKIGGKVKEFHYNYLDFEIIKQEFLIDWMNRRLKGNSKKQEIYSKYVIGGKTIKEIVAQDPSKELEILQKLPLGVFNDITSEVNDNVGDELKTEVDPLSENKGGFAEVTKQFEEAKEVAKSPIAKLKAFISGKKEETTEPVIEKPEEEEPPPPPVVLEPKFDLFKVKKNQIDYPYFQKEASIYKAKMSLIRVKMGTKYTEFNKTLGKLFANVTDSSLIRRRTPKHEVIYPFLIKETLGDKITNHLLILGAEVKAKQLGMGYGPQTNESTHSYTCFFQYGCESENPILGEIQDKRNARGIEFNIYDFSNDSVQKIALKLFDLVMKK